MALKRSLHSSPLGPATGALLLLDDDLDLDVCVGRHGRNHALLLDEWALARLLTRQWPRGRCNLLSRRLALRRPREAQRRLLGGGEAAQAHLLATAPHLRQVGLGLARMGEVHAEVARLVLGHAQHQPLRLRLLLHLLARQRRCRCSPLRRHRLPLR
eukprot:scaffold18917_cov59-Phaeocystis_antarctica.AAC.2